MAIGSKAGPRPIRKIRLTQLADIGDGIFINKSSRFVNAETAGRLRCTFLEPDDILIARMPDPLGRACIFPDIGQQAITAVDVFIWRSDRTTAEPRWLARVINSPDIRDKLLNEAGGTTRQRVAGGKLKTLAIPTPPLAEQRRIVAKLDGLTGSTARAREQLGRIPKLIQKYREAILTAAFTGDLTKGWRRSNGLPTPKMTTLGTQVSDISYGTAKKCPTDTKGVPGLRIPNVFAGTIDLSDLKFADFEPKELAKLRLQDGDILVVRSNGSVDLVGSHFVELGGWPCICRLSHPSRPKKGTALPRFLRAMLQTPQVKSSKRTQDRRAASTTSTAKSLQH